MSLTAQDDVPADSEADDRAEILGIFDETVDLHVRYLADRHALSDSAALLLNRLWHEGPLRLTALAHREGTSQPAMTQMVQRLERQQLVERLSDPDDGRVAMVALSPAGRRLLIERASLRHSRLKELLDTLTEDDEMSLALAARVALPILRRLKANIPAPAKGDPAKSDPVKTANHAATGG